MPLPRRRESVRRFRQSAEVALHCLRVVLQVCVAVPALGQVQGRRLHEVSQLGGVELVCWHCTVADRALVQGLLVKRIFLSVCSSLRLFRGARNAFGFLADLSVFSPQNQPVGVECRDWQLFATHHALYLRCPTTIAFRLSACIVVLPPRTQACWIIGLSGYILAAGHTCQLRLRGTTSFRAMVFAEDASEDAAS